MTLELPVDVSVLVPAKDEAENLPLFMELAEAAFRSAPSVRFEVVVVDDGSVDGSWAVLLCALAVWWGTATFRKENA